MCEREMTLGEEIINLTKRGVDVSTVERMYRKYIDLDEKVKSDDAYAIDLKTDIWHWSHSSLPLFYPSGRH